MDGSALAVSVRPFRAKDAGRWDDFVRGRTEGTFFHLSAWQRVVERAFGHRPYSLLAERAGALTGVLPLTHVRSVLFGSSLISNAFGVYGGPLATDEDSRQALDAEAVRLADTIGAPVLEMRGMAPGRA